MAYLVLDADLFLSGSIMLSSDMRFVTKGGVVVVALDQPDIVLGRHAMNEIRLALATVARRHGHLRRHEHLYTYSDTGSTNGSHLNGDWLSGTSEVLRDGDRLKLGEFEAQVFYHLPWIYDEAEQFLLRQRHRDPSEAWGELRATLHARPMNMRAVHTLLRAWPRRHAPLSAASDYTLTQLLSMQDQTSEPLSFLALDWLVATASGRVDMAELEPKRWAPGPIELTGRYPLDGGTALWHSWALATADYVLETVAHRDHSAAPAGLKSALEIGQWWLEGDVETDDLLETRGALVKHLPTSMRVDNDASIPDEGSAAIYAVYSALMSDPKAAILGVVHAGEAVGMEREALESSLARWLLYRERERR